jgi:hypothetical protein
MPSTAPLANCSPPSLTPPRGPCARSAGAPHTAPAEILLTAVAAVPIQISGRSGPAEPWEVRCVRATPAPGAGEFELPAGSG